MHLPDTRFYRELQFRLFIAHYRTKFVEQQNKPEIVIHFNQTKSGVDNLDHLVRMYSCRRATHRWPMNMFYNLLDVAACAAFILWISQNLEWESCKKQKRRLFLRDVANELILPE